MSRTPLRTVDVDRSRSRIYLKRAENLFAILSDAIESENFDVAATNGIQATIAYADALSIGRLGLRSRGQDHRDVVMLLIRIRSQRTQRIATLVQLILDRKNEVEYGDREVTRSDAKAIVSSVTELRELVRASLA